MSTNKMQERSFFTQKRTAAVALCIVLIMLIQQACAGPVVPPFRTLADPDGTDATGGHGVGALRRIARMTPLWRILNSKPFGAYCQNNYECSTGLCRAGQCSISGASAPVKY